MALVGKVINIRIVGLIETHKIGILTVSIKSHMQIPQTTQGARQKIGPDSG
jgi:hypothetical protein